MIIAKKDFLITLVDHLIKKFNLEGLPQDELQKDTLITAMDSMLASHMNKMKEAELMDPEGNINYEKLEASLKNFFQLVPQLNFPISTLTITVTAKDVYLFLEDLKSKAVIDVLPNE